MLFSEPKIPQFYRKFTAFRRLQGFSALQRAENSSIGSAQHHPRFQHRVFQCSSASRKFLNQGFECFSLLSLPAVSVLFSEPKIPQWLRALRSTRRNVGFSALQRAENSSIQRLMPPFRAQRRGFSALQRAENSSIKKIECCDTAERHVSVLFSEPKIPQSFRSAIAGAPSLGGFSALQRAENSSIVNVSPPQTDSRGFSALQRAENSSILLLAGNVKAPNVFQCSSASRKFLNFVFARLCFRRMRVSVLFSEPKIPQSAPQSSSAFNSACFSALQRAENSSIEGVDVV